MAMARNRPRARAITSEVPIQTERDRDEPRLVEEFLAHRVVVGRDVERDRAGLGDAELVPAPHHVGRAALVDVVFGVGRVDAANGMRRDREPRDRETSAGAQIDAARLRLGVAREVRERGAEGLHADPHRGVAVSLLVDPLELLVAEHRTLAQHVAESKAWSRALFPIRFEVVRLAPRGDLGLAEADADARDPAVAYVFVEREGGTRLDGEDQGEKAECRL